MTPIDLVAFGGREQRRAAKQTNVMGDGRRFRLRRREPDRDTDGRAGWVETVLQERSDDVLVDHHQRQRLPAAVVGRHGKTMRRDIHRLGAGVEAVHFDGRGNLLRNLGAGHDIALGGHGHSADGTCEKGATGELG